MATLPSEFFAKRDRTDPNRDRARPRDQFTAAVEALTTKVETYLSDAPQNARYVDVPMGNESMEVRQRVIHRYRYLKWTVEDRGGPIGKRCLRFF